MKKFVFEASSNRRPGHEPVRRFKTLIRPLLAAVAVATPMEASAQEFTSPKDLLVTLYQTYLSGGAVTNFEPYFSDGLTAALKGGRLDSGSLLELGFDPITGVEEAGLLTVFNIETLSEQGLSATSVASFQDDGVPVTITFGLVREDRHGWQIHTIAGTAGGTSWSLDDLVAAVGGASGP